MSVKVRLHAYLYGLILLAFLMLGWIVYPTQSLIEPRGPIYEYDASTGDLTFHREVHSNSPVRANVVLTIYGNGDNECNLQDGNQYDFERFTPEGELKLSSTGDAPQSLRSCLDAGYRQYRLVIQALVFGFPLRAWESPVGSVIHDIGPDARGQRMRELRRIDQSYKLYRPALPRGQQEASR